MDRVTRPNPWLLAGVGVILTLILLPATSWVPKNQLDSVRYGVDPMQYDVGVEIYTPSNIVDPTRLQDSDEVGFARALLAKSSEDSRTALIDFAKSHPSDRAALATFIRYAMMAGHLGPDKDGKWESTVKTTYGQAIDATEKGQALDVGNAYFPMFRAVIARESGNEKLAFKYLHDAAKADRYDDYAIDALKVETGEIERTWGYRGEATKLSLAAAVLLPHLAHLKSFGKWVAELPNDRQGMQARWDMFQFVDRWSKGCSTLIDIYVQMAVVSAILSPGAHPGKNLLATERYDFFRQKAPKLDADIAKEGIAIDGAGVQPIFDRVAQYAVKGQDYMATSDELAESRKIILSSSSTQCTLTALLACAAVVLFVAGLSACAGRINLESRPLAVPYLLGLGVVGWTTYSMNRPIVTPIGTFQGYSLLLGLLGALAVSFWPVGQSHSRIVKFAVFGLFALATALFPAPFMPCFGVVAVAWATASNRTAIALLVYLATISGLALVMGNFMAGNSELRIESIRFGVGVGIFATVALLPLGRWSAKSVLVPAFCAMSIIYLGLVASVIRTNEVLRPSAETFTHEAEIVRGTRPMPTS